MNPTIAILGIIAFAVIVTLMMDYFVPFPWPKKAAAKPAFTEHCIGKVIYLQFDNAVVTKLKPDGKIWTCGGV